MFKPVLQYLVPNFLVTHEDIYLELGGIQYHYQVVAAVETNTRSPVYTYTDLSHTAERENFRSTLLEETGLDAVPQAAGYLTLSNLQRPGWQQPCAGVAELVGEVCP